jgi:hypothetical protein
MPWWSGTSHSGMPASPMPCAVGLTPITNGGSIVNG